MLTSLLLYSKLPCLLGERDSTGEKGKGVDIKADLKLLVGGSAVGKQKGREDNFWKRLNRSKYAS